MALAVGTKIGAYEITGRLGAGGMGEVYRALDTKLGRTVALKVLPETFRTDLDRLTRFQREAQLLATLNHPHIAAIYGVEDTGAVHALVLELVDGPTLADRIDVGAMPVDEALAVAIQITEALEAAHEKGIIHRDLKPANVKLTADGRAKVLDFGLAKLVESGPPDASLSTAPTVTAYGTYAGVILGTAAYMSPEQARGKPIDRRSDVWAFGCVLFEMLTGRQAFAAGETASDAIAAILQNEPDLQALPASAPAAIVKLLRRLLQKDPRERLHDIADARLELRDAIAAPPVAAVSITGRRSWSSHLPTLVIALVAAIVGATIARQVGVSSRGSLDVTRFPVIAAPQTSFVTLGRPGALGVISPDGRHLVIAAANSSGREQLWIRPLESLTSYPLKGTDNARFPFWSPDSRSVAFFSGGKLRKINVASQLVQELSDADSGFGGAWGPAGTIVFGTSSGGRGGKALRYVSENGGSPHALTRPEAGHVTHRFPSFLPDGRVLFYVEAETEEGAGVYTTDPASGETKRLLTADSGAVYAAGYLLFVKKGTLFAQRFALNAAELQGDPQPIAEDVEAGITDGFVSFSASENGTLAYAIGSAAGAQKLEDLVWLDRTTGDIVAKVGTRANYRGIDVAPGSRTIAAHVHAGQGGDVRLIDARGQTTSFTFNAAEDNSFPVWSPDGHRIAFASLRSGQWGIYIKPSDGSGAEARVTTSDAPVAPTSWSVDGRLVVYERRDPSTGSDIWMAAVDGSSPPEKILGEPADEWSARVSPDGKWLAYVSVGDSSRIFVKPFPRGQGQWPIAAGYWPEWRHDGRELFFFRDAVMSDVRVVETDPTGSVFKSFAPKTLFRNKYINVLHRGVGLYKPYAVAPDGQQLLIPYSGVITGPKDAVNNCRPELAGNTQSEVIEVPRLKARA